MILFFVNVYTLYNYRIFRLRLHCCFYVFNTNSDSDSDSVLACMVWRAIGLDVRSSGTMVTGTERGICDLGKVGN